jgi:hypothetical protein
VSRLGVPFVAYSLRASPGSPLLLDPYLLAVGVGYSPRDHKEPFPFVRRSKIGSSKREPQRVIPDLGKALEHGFEPAVDERRDVFDRDEPGTDRSDDPEVVEPKAASHTLEASSCASDRDVLAWEATADDPDGGELVAFAPVARAE